MEQIKQIPVTGFVAYEKVVYQTYENERTFDVHYLGDNENSKCTDDTLNSIQLLENTLVKQKNVPIDVFVEVGLGYEGDKTTNYLNSLITTFQKKYNCLTGRPELCKDSFPKVNFHNVDVRHTLFLEYKVVLDSMKRFEYDYILYQLIKYATLLTEGKKDQLPYASYDNKRELLRLFWVYDMIQYRRELYQDRGEPYAKNVGLFLLDLYYVMLLYKKGIETENYLHRFLPENIKIFYKPYYHYRLSHEYRLTPEVITNELVRSQFELAITKKLNYITSSYSPLQLKQDLHKKNKTMGQLVDQSVMYTSWIMDMYVCFRSMKPYINHIIIILGVHHINQMKEFMNDLEISIKESIRFENNSFQCISIPLADQSLLIDTDHLFEQIIPEKPSVTHLGKKYSRRKRKRTKKRSCRRI